MKMALVVPFPSTKPHCSSAISGFILFLTLIMMILNSWVAGLNFRRLSPMAGLISDKE